MEILILESNNKIRSGKKLMLVSMLYDLLSKDVSYLEVTSIKLCPKGEGIWDALGYYNPNLPVKITVCEHEIKECSRRISKIET